MVLVQEDETPMHSSLGKILSTIVGFVLSQAKRGDSQFTPELKFLEIPLRTYYIYIYIKKDDWFYTKYGVRRVLTLYD